VRDCWQGDDEARAAFDASPQAARYPGGMYRNQWWVKDPVHGVFLGSGIHGQSLFIHLPSETVIVKLSTWPEALDLSFAAEHVRAFEAIAAALHEEATPQAEPTDREAYTSASARRPTSRK
jgi:CubicO group peptidase (beta-lactamase class C family)